MAEAPKNYVCTLSSQEAEDLRALLDYKGWTFSTIPYAKYRAVPPDNQKVNVTVYESGKCVVQGKDTSDFVQFVLEPEILHTLSFGYENLLAAEAAGPILPHGGTDESGKGDFFGPLVVASVFVTEETGKELISLGVCDSKLIKSTKKIYEISAGIRNIVKDGFSVLILKPETYNRLYSQIGNLNQLLAWGHARVIENLLEKVPTCPRVLSDKFGNPALIERSLMKLGRKIVLDQEVRAESDVAVAAASILARESFLKGMEKLEEIAGCSLPRGAGVQVPITAKEILETKGIDTLNLLVKTHFKTYLEVINNNGN